MSERMFPEFPMLGEKPDEFFTVEFRGWTIKQTGYTPTKYHNIAGMSWLKRFCVRTLMNVDPFLVNIVKEGACATIVATCEKWPDVEHGALEVTATDASWPCMYYTLLDQVILHPRQTEVSAP